MLVSTLKKSYNLYYFIRKRPLKMYFGLKINIPLTSLKNYYLNKFYKLGWSVERIIIIVLTVLESENR